MASNVFTVNVYQLDQTVYPRDAPIRMAFPTTGVILKDCSASPTRSLSSGYNVYGVIVIPSSGAANSDGHMYYTAETLAQLVTLANA